MPAVTAGGSVALKLADGDLRNGSEHAGSFLRKVRA